MKKLSIATACSRRAAAIRLGPSYSKPERRRLPLARWRRSSARCS